MEPHSIIYVYICPIFVSVPSLYVTLALCICIIELLVRNFRILPSAASSNRRQTTRKHRTTDSIPDCPVRYTWFNRSLQVVFFSKGNNPVFS